MMQSTRLLLDAELTATVIRRDGSHRDLTGLRSVNRLEIKPPREWWKRLYARLRPEIPFLAGMTLGAFIAWMQGEPAMLALVTTAGINYEASAFASNANPMSNFKYHDSGTGTTAAAIGDTALQSAAGPARVSGTASNPTASQYKSSAVISYTTTLAITEWGLFSASSSGTLWDHRVFSAYNVNNTESIQFDYTLTCVAGGS